MKYKNILNIDYIYTLNNVDNFISLEEKILYLEKILFLIRINKKTIENYNPYFEKKIKKKIAYLKTILSK